MKLYFQVSEKESSKHLLLVQKIINYTLNKYHNEITKTISYLKENKSPTRKWFEFIYCILAGTQVRTKIVKKSYESLFEKLGTGLNLRNVANSKNIEDRIMNILKSNGYRFYTSKTISIINTAKFFKRYEFNPDDFIAESDNYNVLRKQLVKIKGIGIKIASHWLRNLGFEIPIIDIHIKNLLYYLGIINKAKKSYHQFEEIMLDLSYDLNISLFLLDLSIWIYGREYCANRKCKYCIYNEECMKSSKNL